MKTYKIIQLDNHEYDIDLKNGRENQCLSGFTYGQIMDLIPVLVSLGFIDEDSLEKEE